ncbi:MAG TPA: hypothetical protein VFA38_04675 [Nitrospirales bacterium]|nr:hypothetical protein [Nitrospirales bacterium]
MSIALLFAGCAGSLTPGEDDTADVRMEAPPDLVLTALTNVLTEQGYDVKRGDSDRSLRTGFREQSGLFWDSLLNSRLGVGRSRVEALVAPDGDAGSRVTVMVRHEGKKWMWEPWRQAKPPVQDSAVNQIRLLRNELRALDVQFISESSPNSSPNRSAIR